MTSHTTSPPSTVLRPAGDLRLLTWPALDASGADAVVTARSGGVSSGPYESLNLSLSVGDDPGCVRENRRRLATAFGADLRRFRLRPSGARRRRPRRGRCRPGERRLLARRRRRQCGRAGDAGGADALVTTSPGVVLAILTADCVPIVLHDPVAGVLACVHAGWRGTVAGVTAAALAAMQRLGARPSDVTAGIGPAIGADRYQVGPDVHEAVTRTFGPAAAGFIRPDPSAPGRWLLDLWAANRHALRQAGVPGPQIHTTGIPTGPDPGHFFSDRTARPCGRLALVARLRPGGAR